VDQLVENRLLRDKFTQRELWRSRVTAGNPLFGLVNNGFEVAATPCE
jgi:hypothetical protein